jgi:hypothetical protein
MMLKYKTKQEKTRVVITDHLSLISIYTLKKLGGSTRMYTHTVVNLH